MNIKKATTEDREKYITFLQSIPHTPFLQSWSWGDFQESLGNKVARYDIEHDSTVVGVFQVIEKHVPLLKQTYLYIPYGPVMHHGHHVATQEMFEVLKKDFPEAVFLKIEPFDDQLSKDLQTQKTERLQPGKTLVIDLSQSEEGLQKSMHQKTRYNIRLSQKNGLSLSVNENTVEALQLIHETSKRQGYKDQGTEYYKKMHSFFGETERETVTHIYSVWSGEDILASGLFIDFAGTRTYLFGGSSTTHKNLMAPYLLHWQAIRDAQSMGMKMYDFWGLETSKGTDAGFVKFKRGFGGTEKIYPHAFDLVQKKAAYLKYKTAKLIQKLKVF
jgi:peptidoglycan pentaglycine glycine transferase (the first glycine)